MPFGLHSLKRKFIATVDPTFSITNGNIDDFTHPPKRMQLEESASIRETNAQNPQDSSNGRREEMETLLRETEELEAKLKESEEICARVEKDAEHADAQVKKLREQDLCCIICHQVIRNPQTLTCGHSACYPCLRKWWTRPLAEDDDAPMIDTEAESDLEEEEAPGMDVRNHVDPAPAPCPRRRHRFASAVNRDKHCPYCDEVIDCRPAPNFRIRDMIEITNSHLLPLSTPCSSEEGLPS